VRVSGDEIERLRQKVTNLETLLLTERGITAELRRDKETTQKQLELATLRLPAPKVGFGAVCSVVVERKKSKNGVYGRNASFDGCVTRKV